MSTLLEMLPMWKEALAAHDLLGLFLPADKIFVTFTDTRDFLVVAKDGEREGAVRIGRFDDSYTRERFMREWDETVTTYNKSGKKSRARLLERSAVRQRAVHIVAQMTLKGFELRKSQ